MENSQIKLANLSGDQLTKLQELEQTLGARLVALESRTQSSGLSLEDIQTNLSSEGLKTVQDLELELDVVLLAYQKNG